MVDNHSWSTEYLLYPCWEFLQDSPTTALWIFSQFCSILMQATGTTLVRWNATPWKIPSELYGLAQPESIWDVSKRKQLVSRELIREPADRKKQLKGFKIGLIYYCWTKSFFHRHVCWRYGWWSSVMVNDDYTKILNSVMFSDGFWCLMLVFDGEGWVLIINNGWSWLQ